MLPGKMEALLKAQQEFADLMYKTVPGDHDDDDIYIMMKFVFVAKNHHFLSASA